MKVLTKKIRSVSLLLFIFIGISSSEVVIAAEKVASKFTNDIQSPSFPRGVEIMQNFCSNPQASEFNHTFYAKCNWCPSEASLPKGNLKLNRMIEGSFTGNGNEILIQSTSCERWSLGQIERNSAILLNLETSQYIYFPSIFSMDSSCVKFTVSKKTLLVCDNLEYETQGSSEGAVSQFFLEGKSWKTIRLMKTMTDSFMNYGIQVVGLEKKKLGSKQKLIIHLKVGNMFSGRNPAKEYKLSYTLDAKEKEFKLDRASRKNKILILSSRP